MSRWVATCAYDGTGFSGWQSQLKKDAIQDAIEARLAAIFKADIRIHGSGRTDAGVHARGQVFHFDADWTHGTEKLRLALAFTLPPAIQIRSVKLAKPDFHARFSATGKHYDYYLRLGESDPFLRPFEWALSRPIDWEAVRKAATVLTGRHDFKAFSADNGTERENTVRTLRRLAVSISGRSIRITAEAEGFLYKMVRSLVGTLIAVGEGRLTSKEVEAILSSGHRTPQVRTAPAHGLFLVKVQYGRRGK